MPNNSNVSQIVVEGSGMPAVNGTYTRVAEYHAGEVPVYTKGGQEPCTPNCFIILRLTYSGQTMWYIGNYENARAGESMNIKFRYESQENANCLVPPERGWKVYYGQRGQPQAHHQAPTCRLIQNGNSITRNSNVSGTSVAAGHPSNTNNGQLDNGMGLGNNNSASSVSSTAFIITNDTSASFPNVVDRVAIQNYTSKLNGIYTRVGSLEGAPVYTKEGKEPRTLNCYAILRCRPTVGEQMKWYIGNWGARADGNISFNFLYVSHKNERFLFPPENGWYSLTHNNLVRPNPRLILPNDHIAIEGCGNVELNGTYSRNYVNTNDIEYKRKGQWNGQVVIFSIYQKVHKVGSNYK